jgi:RNA ligase
MRDLPYSNRIEPYLEAISGCDAFFVADREYGRIINYRRMGADVFPDPATAPDPHTAYLWGLRRQCRGLVFDLAGNVISPGFEKFFNLNENAETQCMHMDLGQPHVICEKADGSLIRPIPMSPGGYRLATKMGLTSVALQPEAWVQQNPSYDRFIQHMLSEGWVPLMEWCSRQNRIVVDYPNDRLILLAMRRVQDGVYMTLAQMQELATKYGVELVRRYEGTVCNMQYLMDETRDLQGQEGWVIWFDNGYRVKLKASSYLEIHKAKEALVRENVVLDLILSERLDDVKSLLTIEDNNRLSNYETCFWHGLNLTVQSWMNTHIQISNTYKSDRKSFAVNNAIAMDPFLRAALFKAWGLDSFDFRTYLIDIIKKNISTQSKVDAVRHLWGGVIWTPQCVVAE